MDFESKANDVLSSFSWTSKAGGNPMAVVAQALREAYEQGRRDENKACADECYTHGIHAQGWATAAGCRERIQKRMPNASAPNKGDGS